MTQEAVKRDVGAAAQGKQTCPTGKQWALFFCADAAENPSGTTAPVDGG
ncbi:hypothetical protein ROLI_029180 [Roseobacter fucihabitans]|uniref:Uncharacterized protein n=1 Tax=Roseobacter fucihabitans TaxID=1537242 RepID=A0ABZ2BWS0_9RHOB|nr:hypothetical protein [Roseobacter litoralis]